MPRKVVLEKKAVKTAVKKVVKEPVFAREWSRLADSRPFAGPPMDLTQPESYQWPTERSEGPDNEGAATRRLLPTREEWIRQGEMLNNQFFNATDHRPPQYDKKPRVGSSNSNANSHQQDRPVPRGDRSGDQGEYIAGLNLY